MSEDVLFAATRALREQETATESARFTRARVMASLHKHERRRSTRLAFLLPIAAVLVGSTAFGAASGRLPASWQEVSSTLGLSPAPSPQKLDRSAEKGAALVRRAPARASAPKPLAQTPSLAAAAPEAAKVEPPAGKPLAELDPSHELYRRAHRLHFAEGNPAGALGAWDAYLAAAPRGRFATEARYNRALCLVRLGRSAEARTALEPFAAGRVGGYRQREASALIEALGAK